MTDPTRALKEDWNRVETIKNKADSYLNEPGLCNITVACILIELRDRLAAIEARLAQVAAPLATADGLSPVEPIKLLQHLEWVADALKDIDWPVHSAAVTSAVELLRQPAHSAATTAPLPRLDRDAVAAGWRKIRDERESATAAGLSPMEPAPQAPQGVTVEELANAVVRVFTEKKPGNDMSVAYDIPVALWSDPRIGPLLRGEGAPAAVPVVLPVEPPVPYRKNFLYEQGWRDCWAAAHLQLARQQGGQAPLEGLVPVAYYAGDGVQILRITSEAGDWSVRNSRHVSPIAGFSTAAAAWAELQRAREPQ